MESVCRICKELLTDANQSPYCNLCAVCAANLDENEQPDFDGLMEPDIDTPFDGWP